MKRPFFTNTNEHGKISICLPCLTSRQASSLIRENYFRMNPIIIIVLMLLFIGCSNVYSQNIPVYPIPSYNIEVNGYADFMNQISTPQQNYDRGIRRVIIHLKSALEPSVPCQATVWVYSLDLTTVLGPFSLACGETLSVPIDERQWGAFVETEDKVIVDVWIE